MSRLLGIKAFQLVITFFGPPNKYTGAAEEDCDLQAALSDGLFCPS